MLFHPFRPGADGSGLGLYISWELARSFGGELEHVTADAGCYFPCDGSIRRFRSERGARCRRVFQRNQLTVFCSMTMRCSVKAWFCLLASRPRIRADGRQRSSRRRDSRQSCAKRSTCCCSTTIWALNLAEDFVETLAPHRISRQNPLVIAGLPDRDALRDDSRRRGGDISQAARARRPSAQHPRNPRWQSSHRGTLSPQTGSGGN